MKKLIQNYINHIVFVIDRSGSMAHLEHQVEKVFNNQIKYLATRSTELDQETRTSVYTFDDAVECVVYDKDVLRLPDLTGQFKPRGMTALLDGTYQAITDLAETPQKYGDHAFLIYVITDGLENASRLISGVGLSNKIKSLPDNWTLAVLVPDQTGMHEAKKFGFPSNNIAVWSTTAAGLEEVSKNVIQRSVDSFMQARSTGIRGTKGLFEFDTSNLDQKTVKSVLNELKTHQYDLLPVTRDAAIREYVEALTGRNYVQGSAYYMLTKREEIQNYKQLCVQHKVTGKIYSGTQARSLLGLPNHTVKVSPESHSEYDIFIQSTSVNRKLLKGTKVLVLK